MRKEPFSFDSFRGALKREVSNRSPHRQCRRRIERDVEEVTLEENRRVFPLDGERGLLGYRAVHGRVR